MGLELGLGSKAREPRYLRVQSLNPEPQDRGGALYSATGFVQRYSGWREYPVAIVKIIPAFSMLWVLE